MSDHQFLFENFTLMALLIISTAMSSTITSKGWNKYFPERFFIRWQIHWLHKWSFDDIWNYSWTFVSVFIFIQPETRISVWTRVVLFYSAPSNNLWFWVFHEKGNSVGSSPTIVAQFFSQYGDNSSSCCVWNFNCCSCIWLWSVFLCKYWYGGTLRILLTLCKGAIHSISGDHALESLLFGSLMSATDTG